MTHGQCPFPKRRPLWSGQPAPGCRAGRDRTPRATSCRTGQAAEKTGKDVDAVFVLLDPPGDAVDLALDAVQAPHQSVLAGGVCGAVPVLCP